MLVYYYTSILLRYHTIMLVYYYTTILSYYNVSILLYQYITMLSYRVLSLRWVGQASREDKTVASLQDPQHSGNGSQSLQV